MGGKSSPIHKQNSSEFLRKSSSFRDDKNENDAVDLKSKSTTKTTKNFMCPTISAASKVASTKKTILGERNESQGLNLYDHLEVDTVSSSPIHDQYHALCPSPVGAKAARISSFSDQMHRIPKADLKNFMSPTISYSSKTASAKKRILFEKNGEIESNLLDSPSLKDQNVDPCSLNPSSVLIFSSNASDLSGRNVTTPDRSPLPYDPVTNYLSPRPKFLHYIPKRRQEAIRREEIDDSDDSSDSQTTEEVILNSHTAASLSVPSRCEHSNLEDESQKIIENEIVEEGCLKSQLILEEISLNSTTTGNPEDGALTSINNVQSSEPEEEIKLHKEDMHEIYEESDGEDESLEEDDEKRSWHSNLVLKFFSVLGLLILPFMLSSTSLPVYTDLGERRLEAEDPLYRFWKDRRMEPVENKFYPNSSLDFFGNLDVLDIESVVEVDLKEELDGNVQDPPLMDDDIDRDQSNSSLEFFGKLVFSQVPEHGYIEEREPSISFVSLNKNQEISDAARNLDILVENLDVLDIESVVEVDLKEELDENVQDPPLMDDDDDKDESEQDENAGIETEKLSEDVNREARFSHLEDQVCEITSESASSVHHQFLSNLWENVDQTSIRTSESQFSLNSIAEQKMDQAILTRLNTNAKSRATVMSISELAIAGISLLGSLFLGLFYFKIKNRSSILKKTSSKFPPKQSLPVSFKKKESSPSSNFRDSPVLELLSEFSLNSVSGSMKKLNLNSKPSEEGNLSQSHNRKSGRKHSSSANNSAVPSPYSELQSPSTYGSFTVHERIIKKEETEDGEVIKVVTTTPVRRSSRIRKLVLSP